MNYEGNDAFDCNLIHFPTQKLFSQNLKAIMLLGGSLSALHKEKTFSRKIYFESTVVIKNER